MRRDIAKPVDRSGSTQRLSGSRRRRQHHRIDETDQLVTEVLRILSSIFTLKNMAIAFTCCILILVSCVGVIWHNPCENGTISSSILQNFGTIFSPREWDSSVLEDAKQYDIRCMCDWMWLNDDVTVQECYNNELMNAVGHNNDASSLSNGNHRSVPPSCFIKGFGIGPTEIYRNTVIISCALKTSIRIGASHGSLVGYLLIVPSSILQISGRFVLFLVELILSIINNTLVPIVRFLIEDVSLRIKQRRNLDEQSEKNARLVDYDVPIVMIGSDTIINDLTYFMTTRPSVEVDCTDNHNCSYYEWHIVPKSFSLFRAIINSNARTSTSSSTTTTIASDDEINVDMLTITTIKPNIHKRFSLLIDNDDDVSDVKMVPKFRMSIRFKTSPYACIDTSHFTNQQGSLFRRINEVTIGNDRLARQRMREILEITSNDEYVTMMRDEDDLSSSQTTALSSGSTFGRRGVRSTTLECSSLGGEQFPVYEGSVLIRIYEEGGAADGDMVTIANIESRYRISSNITLNDDEKSRLLEGIVKETFWSNEPMKLWRNAFNDWFKKSNNQTTAMTKESISKLWNIELIVVSSDTSSSLNNNHEFSAFSGGGGSSSLESLVVTNAFSNLIYHDDEDDNGIGSNFKIHSVQEGFQRNNALMSFARNIGSNYCDTNDNTSSLCTSLVVMSDVHFWITQRHRQPNDEMRITISRHRPYSDRSSDILHAVRDGMLSKQESDSFLFSDNTFSCWFSYFSSSIARHYGISKQLMFDHYYSSAKEDDVSNDVETILTLHNHWIKFEKYFVASSSGSDNKFSASDLILEVGSVLQSYRANPSMSHLCPHILTTTTAATPRKSLLLNLLHRHDDDNVYGGLRNVIMDDDNGRSRVFHVMMKLIKDANLLIRDKADHRGVVGVGGITIDNLFAVESYLVKMCKPAANNPDLGATMKMSFVQCLDGAFSLAYYRHWMSPELSLLTTISNNGNNGVDGTIGSRSIQSFKKSSSSGSVLIEDDDGGDIGDALSKLVLNVMGRDHKEAKNKRKQNASPIVIVDENDQIVPNNKDEDDDDDAEAKNPVNDAIGDWKRRLFFRNRAALAIECIPTSSQIRRYTLNPRHLSVRIYNNSACDPIKL